MKLKIVIKVKMHCEKCRNKALKTAAEVKGVISVSLDGDDMDRVVVIGVNINAICLANRLKKKFPCVTILIVEEVKKVASPSKPPPTPPPPPPSSDSNCCKKKCEDCTKCQSSKCDGKCGCSKCKSPHCRGQCINICFNCQSPNCSGQCSTSWKPLPRQPPYNFQCPPLCTCPRCYVLYCPPPSHGGCRESNYSNCSIM